MCGAGERAGSLGAVREPRERISLVESKATRAQRRCRLCPAPASCPSAQAAGIPGACPGARRLRRRQLGLAPGLAGRGLRGCQGVTWVRYMSRGPRRGSQRGWRGLAAGEQRAGGGPGNGSGKGVAVGGRSMNERWALQPARSPRIWEPRPRPSYSTCYGNYAVMGGSLAAWPGGAWVAAFYSIDLRRGPQRARDGPAAVTATG